MKKKIRHNFNKGIKLHLACANNLIRPYISKMDMQLPPTE